MMRVVLLVGDAGMSLWQFPTPGAANKAFYSSSSSWGGAAYSFASPSSAPTDEPHQDSDAGASADTDAAAAAAAAAPVTQVPILSRPSSDLIVIFATSAFLFSCTNSG